LKAGIQPKHAAKLEVQLTTLNDARSPQHMNVPAWRLHALTGELAGHWALLGEWELAADL
jgi:proteic killer suppression protein